MSNMFKLGVVAVLAAFATALGGPAEATDGNCIAWRSDAQGQEFCTRYMEQGIEVDARGDQGNSDHPGNSVEGSGQLPNSYAVDRFSPACMSNTPDGGSVLCPAALSCAEGPDYVRYWHWVLTYQRPGDVLVSTELVGAECRSSPPAGGPAVVTAAMVAAEMARLPIPATVVAVAPAPTTLVNFDTGFSTDVEPAVFTVTLLGQPVAVRVTPVSFTYDFGDGHTFGPTSDRGAAYPGATVTHAYEQPVPVAASVAVTYAGEFSVAGGAWLAVPGTVTIAGTPVDLSVREARAQLVAG